MMVRTKTAHENEYGDKREKLAGDEYDAPDRAALALEANGYVTIADTAAFREAVQAVSGGVAVPTKATKARPTKARARPAKAPASTADVKPAAAAAVSEPASTEGK